LVVTEFHDAYSEIASAIVDNGRNEIFFIAFRIGVTVRSIDQEQNFVFSVGDFVAERQSCKQGNRQEHYDRMQNDRNDSVSRTTVFFRYTKIGQQRKGYSRNKQQQEPRMCKINSEI
jgi:hypothetical protein